MHYNSTKHLFLFCTISILLVGNCSAPEPNVEAVSQTLQTYQVGKTTIEDFIRDADLINATFPPPYPTDVGTNPPASFLLKCNFRTTPGSPWKIYETGLETKHGYGFEFKQTRKYVVGNTNKPISILAFDKEGNLESISPPPNAPPAWLVYSEPMVTHDSVPSLSRTNIEVVARTLHTYKVGKTTIKDFIRDADLVVYARSPSFQTYLHTNTPYEIGEIGKYSLAPRTDGPWVVYKMSADIVKKNGITIAPVRKYLVGDTKKPICTLVFDDNGKLTGILPEP